MLQYAIADYPELQFVDGMPHDAWGASLPLLIDTYKKGFVTIDAEKLFVWHRLNPSGSGCDFGQTSGNIASQLQIEFEPQTIVQDAVFFSALLSEGATYTVSIGGSISAALNSWTTVPIGSMGMFHGSFQFGSLKGASGAVRVCLSRTGQIDYLCSDGGISKQWRAFVLQDDLQLTVPSNERLLKHKRLSECKLGIIWGEKGPFC